MKIIYLIPIFILITFACKGKDNLPVVTTVPATDITDCSAVSGGIISDEGSSSIIARGVCWSENNRPTIDDNKTNDGIGGGTFSSQISGLSSSTRYYVRAYAINDHGTSYGNEESFYTNSANSYPRNQIIADHTVVDRYSDIPQYYVDKVKQMFLSVPGQSHSEGYYTGLLLLQKTNKKFAVKVNRSGIPEAYTSSYLRASGAMWGDLEHVTGWQYGINPWDWAGGVPHDYVYNPVQAARVMTGLAYAHNNNLTMTAFGYGYCYDDGWVDSYITATQVYNDYCVNNNIPTRVFFTTGPADNYMSQSSEAAYLSSLRWDAIRNHVEQDSTLILFDYNDILSYNDNNQLATQTWNGHTYQVIHPNNMEGGVGSWYSGHIGGNGCLRLGKAMWWMLARIAGWDGITKQGKNE